MNMIPTNLRKHVDVFCIGDVRRHGVAKSNGLPKFEYCLNNNYPTTQLIREATLRGDVVYAEFLLDDGGSIQVHNKPYVDRNGRVCLALHQKYNEIWEKLWRENKPILVRFVIRR